MDRALGHATALRTVGRMFDADVARNVVIQEETDSVWLSWAAHNGAEKSAHYPLAELSRLEQEAQTGRVSELLSRAERRQDGQAWTELLRTLGQDLDEEEAETSSITDDLNWLTVSWMRSGRFVTRQYTAAELWEASRIRAALRRPISA